MDPFISGNCKLSQPQVSRYLDLVLTYSGPQIIPVGSEDVLTKWMQSLMVDEGFWLQTRCKYYSFGPTNADVTVQSFKKGLYCAIPLCDCDHDLRSCLEEVSTSGPPSNIRAQHTH